MEIDKRIETLEGEFKLMRGELKQTLSGVRDYLVNLKLPPSQEAVLLAAAMGGSSSGTSMGGKFSLDRDSLKDELMSERAKDEATEETAEAREETTPAPAALPQKEAPMNRQNGSQVPAQSMPPVNLLANLIRWVVSAKKQIGREQLPAFLDVYGVSGHPFPEMKEVILHLADITAAEPSFDSTADVWSQFILELHGILAGGNIQWRPSGSTFGSNGGSESRREDASKPKPSKLKLVLSSGDDRDREFSLDIKPEKEANDSRHVSAGRNRR